MMMAIKKVLNILSKPQKKSGGVLLLLLLIGVLLEAFSIGLIVPLMGVILQDDFFAKHTWVAQVFNTRQHAHLVAYVMLSFVLLYLIKNLYLVFLAYFQAKFVFGIQRVVSQKLFNIYVTQPYNFYLQRNSAQLIRNATTEINHLSFTINASLLIASEALLIFAIIILLLTIEPIGAFVVIVTLVLAAFAFLKFTKRMVLHWGEERQFHEGMRIQHIQQGLGGIKDLLLLGRSLFFQKEYEKHNVHTTRVTSKQFVMQQLPRLWLEFLAILGLGVLVAIMVLRGNDIQTIFPVLGLFAAAAFRLIPSANRMIASIQVIRYGIPIINTIHGELELKPSKQIYDQSKSAEFSHSIRVNDLSFSYEAATEKSLNKVNLEIEKGTTVGFIGESGSGKSTLIDIVVGLLEPSAGSVEVDAISISDNITSWQKQIGYVSQSIYLTDDTLTKNIAFGIKNQEIDELAVREAVKSAGLEAFISSLPQGLETMVGERGVRLSGGQRQRIAIARALYHSPDVLVLDEATSALDNQTEEEIMASIYSLHGDKTVLIVAHRLNTVKNCDYIYKLDKGSVVNQGVPSNFLELNIT